MTGKDLIIYILQNDMLNEPVYKDGKLLGFISAREAAVKFEVGVATVQVWYLEGLLPGILIGTELLIPANAEHPGTKVALAKGE